MGRDPVASLLKWKHDGAEGCAEVLVWLVERARAVTLRSV